MSEQPQQPSPVSGRVRRLLMSDALPAWFVRARPWLIWTFRRLRWGLNVGFGLGLATLLVVSAWPRDYLSLELGKRRDELTTSLRKISLSQSWSMYAPDPSRGHFYMELVAVDAGGTRRVLEDSYMAEHGWGTARAWTRSRLDIWQHSVTRRIDKVNRNRTWYLRGVCVREARRGYDVQRVEMARVYRRIRKPEHVRKGKELLGPIKRTKAQDGSCRVRIIREMIEHDGGLREADGD